MSRKLALALTLAATLAPALASARNLPEPRLHCTSCLARVVVGGSETSTRGPVLARTTPVAEVQFGGASTGRGAARAAPAPSGEVVANVARPCTTGCCHKHA
jgi:hypothetical protein